MQPGPERLRSRIIGNFNSQRHPNSRGQDDASLLSQIILTASDFVENDIGGSFPDEWGWLAIPGRKPFVYSRLQFIGGVEGSATDHSAGDQSKESFHLI